MALNCSSLICIDTVGDAGWLMHLYYPETTYGIFGAVNSLFSGLAFAALIYTILQQEEELDSKGENWS